MLNLDLSAQTVAVRTDRKQILIGEQLHYELLVHLPSPGYAINFKFPDTIPHFDVISNPRFDTTEQNGSYRVHKDIILTSFDSGLWHIPAFEVLVEKDQQLRRYITDSLPVDVGYSPADSSGQLRDIKPVMEVKLKDFTWIYIVSGILILLLMALLIYIYVKKKRKRKSDGPANSLSAYEEAMKALEGIRSINVEDPGNIKPYHVSLSSVFKRYCSRKLDQNMMNETTGDILLKIKDNITDPGMLSELAEALRCADAVKFAKYLPVSALSLKSLDQVKSVIEYLERISSLVKN